MPFWFVAITVDEENVENVLPHVPCALFKDSYGMCWNPCPYRTNYHTKWILDSTKVLQLVLPKSVVPFVLTHNNGHELEKTVISLYFKGEL